MTTLNAAELAAFSLDVYDAATSDPNGIPDGFVRLSELSGESGDGGLFAAAYFNASTGQLVLAYRGDAELRDLFTNLSFVTSTGDTLFNRALALVDEARALVQSRFGVTVSDDALALTGSGVGGGFASMVSVATGLEAATFNGVQIGGLLSAFEERFGSLPPDFANRIVNYVGAGDAGYAQPRRSTQIGQVIDVVASDMSFFGQLSTALQANSQAGAVLGAISGWLGTSNDDQRNAQRMLMALELQFGAVASSESALKALTPEMTERLNTLMQTDSAGLIAGRSFDRLMIDGSRTGHLQDASGYGASDDLMAGASGADMLFGGEGNDMLFGGDGNDVLVGGAGDDVLLGGAGADVYRIEANGGTDTVHDKQGVNRLVLGDRPIAPFFFGDEDSGWQSADAEATLADTSQGVSLEVAGTTVVLDSFQDGDFGIQRFAASKDPATTTTIVGDQDPQFVDDYLVGTSGNDRIEGGAGGDFIYGRLGDDSIDGGAGDDYLRGDDVGLAGNDVLVGGDGRDVLFGDGGDDWLFAGDLTTVSAALAAASGEGIAARGEWLGGGEGNDVLVGGEAGDVLAGGGGMDLLVGGAGDDFLMGDAAYEPDDPGDWLFTVSSTGQPSYYSLSNPELNDAATAAADLIYGGSGNDWILGGSGDDTLFGDAGDDQIAGNLGSDTIVGGAGADQLYAGDMRRAVSLDFSDDYVDGGDGNDIVYGSSGQNVLFGGAGDDFIASGAGADLIDGGDGNDYIQAQGEDTVLAGAGDDVVTTFGTAAVSIDGGAGNDRLFGEQGADEIRGGDGNDLLRGYEGEDLLDGGAGDDRYAFELGAGADRIIDESGSDVIELWSFEGTGSTLAIARDSIRLVADNSEVSLEYGDAGDRVSLGGDPRGVIEQIDLVHVNGATQTSETIALGDLPVHYDGTEASEILFGVEGFKNDIAGSGGNDILIGAADDDTLVGGTGSDLLRGLDGSDLYVYAPGDGVDTIDDMGLTGADTLSMGVAVSETTLTLSGGLLFLQVAGGEGVKLAGFDPLDAYGSVSVEQFAFSDGVSLSSRELIDRGFDFAGTDTSESITGTNAVDRFKASSGDDRLIGGEGDDVYEFGRGSGKDFIADQDLTPGNFDRVVLKDGLTAADVEVVADADRLTLKVSETDQLAIQWIPSAGFQVESITFADGVVWDLDTLAGLFQPENLPPGLETPLGDQMAVEDSPFEFHVPDDTFADPDGEDVLAFDATREGGGALPGWLSFDAASRTFSGTPRNEDVGPVSVTVSATDTAGQRVADTFVIDVQNTNDAPELKTAIGAVSVAQDDALSFTVPNDTFVDVDAGDTLSYLATLEDGKALPGWLQFDAATATFTGTPGNADVGAYSVHLLAIDGAGATAEDVIALSVSNVNDAPKLNTPLADVALKEGSSLDLELDPATFSDVDSGDTLAFTLSLSDGDALPGWLTFDATTLALSGTPGRADVGEFSLRLTATDSQGASAYDDFLITVNAVPGLTLIGTNGNDVLDGDAGDDTLNGRRGQDWLSGSGGDDTFAFSRDATWSWGVRRVNPDTGESVSLLGRGQSLDIFDGGEGVDTLLGTGRADAILRFDSLSAPAGASERITGIEIIDAGGGSDLVDLTGPTSYGPVTVYGGAGSDVIWSSGGDDLLYGGSGFDRIDGGGGNDYVSGGGGGDWLSGGAGNDLLEGNTGADWLFDFAGNNLLWGRDGQDSLYSGSGSDLLIGGTGNDRITLGGGHDVIAFNRGDGRDVVRGPGEATLSLGGGIRPEDLALRKSGADLVLETGGGERITFQDWYADPNAHSVLDMQLVNQVMQGGASGQDDVPGDQPVETYDFRAIVAAFDEARAMNANLARWQMLDALYQTDPHGFDNLAAGGDLAYQYGLRGTLAGVAVNAAQSVLASTQFGAAPQPLGQFDALGDGVVKLG